MNKNELQELWGEVLYNAFSEQINNEGWLIGDWAHIIEREHEDFDKDYNDNELKTDLYQRMYLIDLEEKEIDSVVMFKPI